MKTYISIFFLLFIINVSFCQENLTSEEDFKEYIINHFEDYDNIIGIYKFHGTILKTFTDPYSGNVRKTKIVIGTKGIKFAIIYKDGKLYRYDLDNIVSKPNDHLSFSIVTPTSSPNMFLINDEIWQMDSKGSLFKDRDMTPDEIKKLFGISWNAIFKYNLKMLEHQECIKIFPTEWDIKALKKQKKSNYSSGTGFAITTNGMIVTNVHVIEGAITINVRGINEDFSRVYKAKVVVKDKKNDLAIIKIDDYSFLSLKETPYVISKKQSNVGENVLVLGYPLRALMGDEIKVTNGIISSCSGFQGDITSYQISAPVQPGNSGGPIFDKEGNLIGIVNAKLSGAENASYAIKSTYLLSLVNTFEYPLHLQTENLLKDYPLINQIKKIKKFIYIIEVKK